MYPLRRMDRCLGEAATYELLTNGLYGVLATVDADGQPHGTPLNYTHTQEDGRHCLYIHAAQEGQKLDNIAHEPRVSFTIVGHSELLPAQFSIAYQSVMVFGIISCVEGVDEKKGALTRLVDKYAPGYAKEAATLIDHSEHKTVVLRLTIDHISGKENKAGSLG